MQSYLSTTASGFTPLFCLDDILQVSDQHFPSNPYAIDSCSFHLMVQMLHLLLGVGNLVSLNKSLWMTQRTSTVQNHRHKMTEMVFLVYMGEVGSAGLVKLVVL